MVRPTTVLALVQTLLVILGYFTVGIVLKMSGYPSVTVLHWNPLAVFLREHGLWFLLLPVVWSIFVASPISQTHGLLGYRLTWIIAISLTLLVITLFLDAAIFPFSVPLFAPASPGH